MKNLTIMLADEILTPRFDPAPHGRQKHFPISSGRPKRERSLLLYIILALSMLQISAQLSWGDIINIVYVGDGNAVVFSAVATGDRDFNPIGNLKVFIQNPNGTPKDVTDDWKITPAHTGPTLV